MSAVSGMVRGLFGVDPFRSIGQVVRSALTFAYNILKEIGHYIAMGLKYVYDFFKYIINKIEPYFKEFISYVWKLIKGNPVSVPIWLLAFNSHSQWIYYTLIGALG